MMNGLKKCFGYGKLLKQLFITLLISCSIFLVDSFVNAGYYNYGSIIPQFGDNDCRIGDNLGISCNKSSYLLTSYDSGYNKSVNSLFRTSDGIGFYYKGQSQTFQGLIYTGFYICSGNFTNFNTGTFYLDPDCYNKVYIGSYENLKNKLLSKTPLYVGTGFPDGYGIVLSLVYDDFYFTEFVGGGNDSYPKNGTYLLKDMGVSGQDYDTLTFGSNVMYSPVIYIQSDGGTISSPKQFNQKTYNSLYNQGYRPALCYGGFGLDDLYSTGNSNLGDIVSGSGATVNELYEVYSGGKDFITWYDFNYLDYSMLKTFKSDYDISRFFGKSKGLIGLGLIRDSYFKGDNFNTANYKFFCNLVLNNLVDISPDAIGLVDNVVNQSYLDDLVNHIGVLIPGTGTALDLLVSQVCTENGFDNIEDCLNSSGTLSDSITTAWNSWSVRGIPDGVDGILPKYIIIGFLGILLLCYLRR